MGKHSEANGQLPDVKSGSIKDIEGRHEGTESFRRKLSKKFTINRQTLPLKITLFLYYGAMAAILPYLTIHMMAIGISIGETAIIYGILPFTSFIGPPLMGFLADKLGQYKSVLIFATAANALFHTLLLAVPYYSETAILADVQLRWTPETNVFQLSPAAVEHCDLFMQRMQAENVSIAISSCTEVYEPASVEEALTHITTEDRTRQYSGAGVCQTDASARSHDLLEFLCNRISDMEDRENSTSSEIMRLQLPLDSPNSCSSRIINYPAITPSNNVISFVCQTDIALDTGVKLVHGNNALTFWLYFFIRVIATVFMSACFTLLDATTLAIVKRQANAQYGTERIWTVLGTAAISPIAGILVDWASRGKAATDYSAAFYVSNVLIILNIISYFVIKMDVEKPEKNVLKDAKRLFRYPEVVVFLIMIFVLGNMWGFVESYLFIFLKDELNAPNYLLGLTLTTGSLTGIPFLYWADTIVNKLGRVNVIAIAFIVYFVRFAGYSYLQDPWWCFPFEAMEAFTYHLMWTAAATYCSILAPKGLLATLTGIMGALHYSLGKGFGSFIGGYVIELVKVRKAFWDFGVASGVFGILYFIINYLWLRRLVRGRNLQPVGRDLVKQKGSVANGKIKSGVSAEAMENQDDNSDDDQKDESVTENMLQLGPEK